MRTITEQFEEFVRLSYQMNQDKLNIHTGDKYVGEFVILRKMKCSYDFITLTSGEHISIPYILIDLFSSLDVYHKGNIFRVGVDTRLDYFIQSFLIFVHDVNARDFSKTIDFLNKLKEIGVGDFIEYLNSSFGWNIPSIAYYNRRNIITYL